MEALLFSHGNQGGGDSAAGANLNANREMGKKGGVLRTKLSFKEKCRGKTEALVLRRRASTRPRGSARKKGKSHPFCRDVFEDMR